LAIATTITSLSALVSVSCSARTVTPGAAPAETMAASKAVAAAPKSDVQPGSGEDKSLDVWRAGVKIEPVSSLTDRHVIHSYYIPCPESPDGKYVLYYTSTTPSGELGDLRIKERATGKETILAENIATEDAHRVACQQWSNNGKTVVYHEVVDGHWRVMAVDVPAGKPRVLARDHQMGFGSVTGRLVPLYGCHWNPGPYRDLELVDCVTGETHTAVKMEDIVKQYPEEIKKALKTTENLSVFFPIMSPDEKKVFFKISLPGGGTDFKSKTASKRVGKVIYDLENKKFLGQSTKWGHPSWTPDSQCIFEKGKVAYNVLTRTSTHYAKSCFSEHPNMAPGNKFFITDDEVDNKPYAQSGDWALAVGSTTKDDYVVLAVFNGSRGATTWRHNHPHPSLSNDGQRIYFNVNDGLWTRLMVATVGDGSVKPDPNAPIVRLKPVTEVPVKKGKAATQKAVTPAEKAEEKDDD
jgi:hypothetical protein